MAMKRFYLPLFAAVALLAASVLAGSAAATRSSHVPPQLAGHWAIPWRGGTEYLTLGDSHFVFSHSPPSGTARGHVSVSGDTITFYSSSTCTGTGTYEFSLSDGGLSFVRISGSDELCPRATILPSGTWTRH